MAFLGNQGTSKNDMLACNLTIEADLHEPFRAQKVHQGLPAGQWVTQMVKDPDTLNKIEPSFEFF